MQTLQQKNHKPMDTNSRLKSIDALRGFDMLFISGLAPLIVAVCSLWPDCGFAGWLSSQMHHAEWNGFTQYDTIFPLFLFLAGMSFPFSWNKQKANGKTRKQIVFKIIRRGFTLCLIGLILNGLLRFGPLSDLRFASVLGHIGIAWMCAALLYINFKPRTLGFIAGAILIGYWLVMWLVPGVDDPFSFQNNLAGTVDRMILPGRLHENNYFDPEGWMSTIPAIVTALLGMFTGEFVRTPSTKISGGKKTLVLLAAALVLIAVSLVWNQVFPINKKLWTSSFVCAAAGYSLVFFALFYWLIDVKGWTKWSFPLRVIGMNSITIYAAQNIIDFRGIRDFFFKGLSGLCPTPWNDIVNNAAYILIIWLFLYFLYRKKVFLKV